MSRIALVVDSAMRDLPGLALVARRLAQRGHTALLVPFNLAHAELWPLVPDFVLLNYLRPTNEAFVRRIASAGIPYAVLDTEGGVLASVEAYERILAPDRSLRGRASYLSWGRVLAGYMAGPGSFGDVVETGCPKYDFYADPWSAAALELLPEPESAERDIVLVNGNFTLANPSAQSPEAEAAFMVRHYGHTPEFVDEILAGQRRKMAGMVRLVNKLAAHFPSTSFVYRPHPFERAETYHTLLDARPNLRVVKAGAVDGWILRARAVLQQNCSTAIEAALAGVPALLPLWISGDDLAPGLGEVSHGCKSEEELTDVLGRILRDEYTIPAEVERTLATLVPDWFHAIDGRSHDRVVDALLARVGPPSDARVRRRCRAIAYGDVPEAGLLARARGRGLATLGMSPYYSIRHRRSFPPDVSKWENRPEKRFTPESVERILGALERADPERGVRVGARSAAEAGEYRFPYESGRAVVVSRA